MILRTISLVLLFCGSAATASAQSINQARSSAQGKLDDAVGRLAAVQNTIREEKLPLAEQLMALEAEVEQIRAEADRARRARDSGQTSVADLEANVKTRSEDFDYTINLLGDFARRMEANIDVSELAIYQDDIKAVLAANESDDAGALDQMKLSLNLLGTGLERLDTLIGGATFEGSAITPTGSYEDGTFVLVGPVVYWASAESDASGLSTRDNVLEPAVISIGSGDYGEEIMAIAQGSTSVMPVDARLGDANRVAQTKEYPWQWSHIQKGGFWIWPILMFAFVSVALSVYKAYEILALPKPKPGQVLAVLEPLRNGSKEEAMRAANEINGPVGKMLQQGVRNSESDTELVEEVMYETIIETQPRVMRLLPFISVTAAVAPLLGLLGTVTGMINVFNKITIFGTGDAKKLADGISEALVTTEFGLIVAIPSLIFFAILSRMARGYLGDMEKISIRFVNGMKEAAPAEA